MIAKDLNNSPKTTADASRPTFAFGRMLLSHAPIAALFNLLVAIFVGIVLHGGKHFWADFVYSMCIGTTVWLLVDVCRYLLWRDNPPHKGKFYLMLVVLAPIAYYLGATLGAWLLGHPLENVLPTSSSGALLSVLFTLSVSLLAAWIFWSRAETAEWKAKAAERQAHAAAVEKQAMQAQLQLLQTQIEPHMLFNTLANLQGLIAIDPARAQQMLDHLIQYLRATLASSRAETTTLAHEFTLLEAYLELMSVRMGSRLTYSLRLPDGLRTQKIPPMLLQPLIENAIKHGLEPKVDGGRIDVTAERDNSTLVLTIADTGLGIDEDGFALHSTPGTQVGLSNIRERLQVLYGDAATFSLISNTPCGTIARIELPFKSE